MAKRKRTKGHRYRKTKVPGVYRREDGERYRAYVFLSYDPTTGKRRFRTKTFTTQEDAEAWRADQRNKRRKGTLTDPCTDTLAEYGRRWLDGRKDNVKRKTWSNYSKAFHTYVEAPPVDAPPVGRRRMNDLRPEHVRALYRWMLDKGRRRHVERHGAGLSRGSVRGLHAVVRQILHDAFDDGAIEIDIAAKLRKAVPTERGRRRRKVKAFTREQLLRFLAAAKTERYHAFWYLRAHTGMRPGEALALRWNEDVDLPNRQVHIRGTLDWGPGGRWQITDPKTSRAARVVAVSADVVKVLEAHRRAQLVDRLKAGSAWEDVGFVFTTGTGRPVGLENLTKYWNRICRFARLGTLDGKRFTPLLPPYSLRHTHATLSLAAGIPVKVVSDRLGHGSIVITLDTYCDYIPHQQVEAVELWDAMLDGRSTRVN